MKKWGASIAVLLLLAGIAWFTVQAPDKAGESVNSENIRSPQDALYDECVAARDHEIHKKTFATIDNPDVQREVLATQKDIAKRECRENFPSQ